MLFNAEYDLLVCSNDEVNEIFKMNFPPMKCPDLQRGMCVCKERVVLYCTGKECERDVYCVSENKLE